MRELPRAEAMRLLASVPVGRLVFTHQALPAIRPVNHLVEDGTIVIGLTPGSAVVASAASGGTVVAYEADALDLDRRLGWTVIVVGVAKLLTDADAVQRHRGRLRPWLAGAMNDIVEISTEMVTGYQLVPQPGDKSVQAAS
jgi:hypothetical protein